LGEVENVIKTLIEIQKFVTPPAGYAKIGSNELANWVEDETNHDHYPFTRFPALHFFAARTNGPPTDNNFSVNIELEGGFSGGASPGCPRAVTFYVSSRDSQTGSSTSLDLNFHCQSEHVDWRDSCWAMNWECDGTMKIRPDAQVQFRLGLTVDSYGRVWPEGLYVGPTSGTSLLAHSNGYVSNWNWTAEWGDDGGIPVLGMKFTTDDPLEIMEMVDQLF
jgi:hypothetical protein